MKKLQHYFHLVTPSPWPLYTAISLFLLTFGTALFLHFYHLGPWILLFGFISLLICLYCWWRDVIIEGTYLGLHTKIVQQSLRIGIVLFIVSEVMFFFSFFWAFFHSSLSPTVEIGCLWPPAEIKVFNPWEVPLLNTLILLTSGCTVTWAHYIMCTVDKKFYHFVLNYTPKVTNTETPQTKTSVINIISYKDKGNIAYITYALALTVLLALLFTFFQAYEYFEAPFTILDGIYGSTFFMLTGFHGFHVIVGTLFLLVCAIRNYFGHFSVTHHIGFEGAVWYWHFVDVVWLFLFVIVYVWGGYWDLKLPETF